MFAFLLCSAWHGYSLDIQFENIGAGFSAPMCVTHAGDGSGRLFIGEGEGAIKIIESSLKIREVPFLDLHLNRNYLRGLAFHPGYRNNGYFYVYYYFSGGTRISRFTVSADPNVADASSEVVLLE